MNWVYSVCFREKKCWEDEVGVLRESSLFAAGVCQQVGSVCRSDLQQLHLREVQQGILKMSE